MKFSIITPSHKYQEYFNELYVSITNQTHTDWEWIVYLNGDFKRNQLSEEILTDERVKIYEDYSNNNSVGYIYWRTNGQTGTTGHLVGGNSGYVYDKSASEAVVFTDSSQVIEIKGTISNDARVGLTTHGFYLPRGM